MANSKLNRRQVLKRGLWGGLTAGLGSSLWLSGCSKRSSGKRPNVILIVVDTLRADHVSCYGYERNTTPNIDKLAGAGILFKKAISAAPWTLPSVATILTSQYPCVLGIRDRPVVIDKRYPLLTEVLKLYDYRTCGVFSHALLSPRLGFGRGFDVYDNQTSPFRREGISSPAVHQSALSFLREVRGQPFFLFLHYFDPHYNYVLHSEYNYYPSYNGTVRSNHPIVDLWRMRHSLSADDLQYLVSLHDSEIAFTDEHIGKLLAGLKKQGLYDNSIIIVTSDHGEEFMERGWIGHCTTLYQELLHVPLIVKLPELNFRIVESPVGLIDVMPTVLRYLGYKIPDGVEGRALDLSSGNPVTGGPIFSETFNYILQKHQLPDVDEPRRSEPIALRSIILGSRKLIYDERKGLRQIYELSEDPIERKNLSGQASEQNRRVQVLLSRWLEYVKTKEKAGPVQDASELFTPEQRKQLESLGYL
jgi:arylsulfatase A-like enzyme